MGKAEAVREDMGWEGLGFYARSEGDILRA